MNEKLGRVVDPSGLDDAPGTRGRVGIVVPRAWADEGAAIVFTAPTRVTCARCDGGGCDMCGRSGALRAPEEVAQRTLRLQIAPGNHDAFVIRLVAPFGEDAGIDQLFVEVTLADEAPLEVRRLDAALPVRARISPRVVALALAIAILVAAGIELAARH